LGNAFLFLIKPLSLTIILPNFASNHRTVFNARGLYWDSIYQAKCSIILIYDMVQYHRRNKQLREILITKFDKYNEFNSKIGNKKCLPFSAHEHPMIWNQLSLRPELKFGGGINWFIIFFPVHVYLYWCTFWTSYSFV
jgi:hypothetical protein